MFGLDIRSRLSKEEIERGENLDKEIPYPSCLNKFLPDDIVVLGWCPTKADFNARLVRERSLGVLLIL